VSQSRALPKKLPPFARLIPPDDELVMIYCGEKAWMLANPGPAVAPGRPFISDFLGLLNSCKFRDVPFERVASIVYPRRADPGAYRWPVQAKMVVVFAGGELQTVTDPLVMELLHQGAIYVGVWANEALTDYDLRRRTCSA
jgi:hypothetical protein